MKRIVKYTVVILLVMIFTSCEDLLFEKEPSNDPVSNFESLWKTFKERYAVFEQRGVDWDNLYTIYRPQVSENTTDQELYTIITGLLSNLDDGHVSLMAPGKVFWSGHLEFRERTKDLLFNFSITRNYLSGVKQINNQYFYGKINGDIGYLYIRHLTGEPPTFMDDFIVQNQNSKGIIIDLRHNGGGDFTNGEVIASRFAGSKTLAFSATPKNGPGPSDYGKTYDYFIEARGPNQFTKPVIVITDGYTISAGENLVLYLSALPNVTTVGENTTGAMGERIEKEMPNGWIYSITGQLITAADGKEYEGPGIPPDIYSINTEAELSNNVDRTLQRAIDELN